MKSVAFGITLLVVLTLTCAQRPFYAGLRPSSTKNQLAQSSESNIQPRSDGGFASRSQEPLPADALGDRELVNYIKTLPADRQPFWYVNRQVIEASRKTPIQAAPAPARRSSFVSNFRS